MQLDEAVNAQETHQKSLNQTMRESLAKPRNKSAQIKLTCKKGAVIISRDVDYKNAWNNNLSHTFEKAQTKISVDNDLIMKDILKIKENAGWKEWITLAKRVGLVDGISAVENFQLGYYVPPVSPASRDEEVAMDTGEVNVEVRGDSDIRPPPKQAEQPSYIHDVMPNISRIDSKLSVYFPLKEVYGKAKFTRAAFILNKYLQIKLRDIKNKSYTLLIGKDMENNAVFLRWITHPISTPELDVSTESKIKECVLIFNRSHQLKIMHISTPLFQRNGDEVKPSNFVTETLTLEKIENIDIQDDDKFDASSHDPTLFFLRRQFPVRCFVDSNGSDSGIVNEIDILESETHTRNRVWSTVYLHWVYEGLCAVAESMGKNAKEVGVSNMNKLNVDISTMDHDTMLIAIAYAADTVTRAFKTMNEGVDNYVLANLSSRYNSYIDSGIDLNTADYFGYRLTQWLLENAEKSTILIPKYDVNAPQSKVLRGRLRSVHCDMSRTAIKTIYTTDVLLDMVRKAYIDPWGLVYPYNDVNRLPEQLKTLYSLSKIFPHPTWAKEGNMNDKQVSVILKSKHMVRFTFHAFRRKFHGSDPVVASKQMEKAASKGKRMNKKARKVEIKTLENALTPKPVTVKQWLRNAASSGAAGGGDSKPAFLRFAGGGGKRSTLNWKNPWTRK